MNQYKFNSLEDFINFFYNSYNSSNNKCNNCEFGNKNAEADFCSRYANSDIPGGFQDASPGGIILATALLGTMLSEQMPFNIQNAVGNWLELLGQIILYFNSQQQYFQGGPGRLYNFVYRNVSNPFCESADDENQQNNSSNDSSSNDTPVNNSASSYDLNSLMFTINELHTEIQTLKEEIRKIKDST